MACGGPDKGVQVGSAGTAVAKHLAAHSQIVCGNIPNQDIVDAC